MAQLPDVSSLVLPNVGAAAGANSHYRKVVATSSVQIVLYALKSYETLPAEVHTDATQILTIVEGSADVTIGSRTAHAKAGDVVVVAPGTTHSVTPTDIGGLKMWSVYTAREFAAGHVDERQPPAEATCIVARLGAGFVADMTVAAADGRVCIAHKGVPVCSHTHASLDAISAWVATGSADVVCPECAAEIGATIPVALRLPGWRKPKPKSKPVPATTGYALLMPRVPKTGEASALVSIAPSDPALHPHAYGSPEKYALFAPAAQLIAGMRPDQQLAKPRQGVHLLLEAGVRHNFVVAGVPRKYPFYITHNPIGGLGVGDKMRLTVNDSFFPAVTRETIGASMSFIVPPKTGVAVWNYQCETFAHMGGPISVFAPGTRPSFSPKEGTLVLQDKDSHLFTVMKIGRNAHSAELSFEEMMRATGMTLHHRFDQAGSGLRSATLVRRDSAGLRELAHPEAGEPAVFTDVWGTPTCGHVYTTEYAKGRLAAHPDYPCIRCFST